MNRRIECFALFSVLIVSISACGQREGPLLRASEIHEAVLAAGSGAPVTTIDFVNVPLDTLFVSRVLASGEPSEANLFLAQPMGLTLLGDTLIVCDRGNDRLIFVDRATDSIIGAYGRRGEGPGEFREPVAVIHNQTYVFVYEAAARRIQVLTRGFKPVTVIPAFISWMDSAPAVSETFLYVPESGRMSDGSVVAYSASPPFDYAGVVIPRISSPDRHPSSLNNLSLAVAPNGDLYAATSIAPYIYVLDGESHEIVRVMELREKDLVIELDGLKERLNSAPPGTRFVETRAMIRSLAFDAAGNLVVGAWPSLAITVDVERLSGISRRRLTIDGDFDWQNVESLVQSNYLALKGKYMYVSSWTHPQGLPGIYEYAL